MSNRQGLVHVIEARMANYSDKEWAMIGRAVERANRSLGNRAAYEDHDRRRLATFGSATASFEKGRARE